MNDTVKIYMTGLPGYSRAKKLLEDKREFYSSRFPKYFIKQFEGLEKENGQEIFEKASGSAGDPGITIVKAGEGGLFGALWELGESLDAGLEVDILKIPVRQEVIEILELADESPYEAESSGCFLLAGDDNAMKRFINRYEPLCGALPCGQACPSDLPSHPRLSTGPEKTSSGVQCNRDFHSDLTQIGKITGSKARVITGPALTRYLTPPSRQAKDTANRQMQRR